MSASPLAHHDALHTLYVQHHGWLRDWLRKRLGNSFDAADLAQDTFVRVIRAHTVPDDLREPRGYLARIAQGLVIDLFRRRSLEQTYLAVLAALPEHQVPSLEAQAILRETLLDLDRLLDGLGAKVKAAFLLSQLESLPYPEIAKRLGVSPRTVSTYLARAMEHCCLMLP